MKPDLRPCPFCGGKAELWKAHPENPKRSAWIACMDRCAVMTKEYDTDEEAVAVWNRRVSDDMVIALKEVEGEIYQAPPTDAEQERVLAILLVIVRAAIAKAEGHS